MLPAPLDASPLDAPRAPGNGSDHAAVSSDVQPLRDSEWDIIEDAINRCGGNISEAAKLLKISPSTIYRKRSARR